jgi:hypothetical protein
MSWTQNTNHISFASLAQREEGMRWTMPTSAPLSEQSAWAPSMIGFDATALPTHWLAWTGTGTTSTRNITIEYTQHFPSWSDAGAKATLSETAISSPELAYNGDGATRQVLVAWTGTDTAHHLNVAQVGV